MTRWYMDKAGTVERRADIWVYEYSGGPTHLYEGTKWCSCEAEYQRELDAALARCTHHRRIVAEVELRERTAA